MADFFSFSKVEAPDLSSSAMLLRNAGESVKAATDAFSAGYQMINKANIERDTRIKQDNTDLWVNRASQANTLEAVNQLKAEIGSPDFQKQYGEGFYIDIGKITEALDSRPTAIEQNMKTARLLESDEQSDKLAGLESSISSAKSEKELQNIIELSNTVGLNHPNRAKFTETLSTRRQELARNESNSLQNRQLQLSLAQQQQSQEAQKILTSKASQKLSQLLSSGATEAEIDEAAHNIAVDIAYKYNMSYESALAGAKGLIGTGYKSITESGAAKAIMSLSPDAYEQYVAANTAMTGYDPAAQYSTDKTRALQNQFPNLIALLPTQDNPRMELKEAIDLYGSEIGENLLNKAMVKMPEELKTRATMQKLLPIAESKGDVKVEAEQITKEYRLYQTMSANMDKASVNVIAAQKVEKTKLEKKYKDNALAQAAVLEVLRNTPSTSPDSDKHQTHLAKLQSEFVSLNKEAEKYAGKTINVQEPLWKDESSAYQMLQGLPIKSATPYEVGQHLSIVLQANGVSPEAIGIDMGEDTPMTRKARDEALSTLPRVTRNYIEEALAKLRKAAKVESEKSTEKGAIDPNKDLFKIVY